MARNYPVEVATNLFTFYCYTAIYFFQMCGRFAFWAPKRRLVEEFSLEDAPEIRPRYNIAPGQDIAAVREPREKPRELVMLRWGLIPSWAKDRKTGYRMINARVESVSAKPAFRAAFKKRRCLIPASGFYEWQKTGGRKQPWFITLKNTDLFAFAGLWERWEDLKTKEVIDSCTILTTDSNELVARLHDRMPVILKRPAYDTWLSWETGLEALKPLLQPIASEEMKAWPVSTLVNNPRNDSPECVKPIKISGGSL